MPTPSKDQLRAEWLALADEWTRRMHSPAGDENRDGLLDPWMLDAVGDVAGKDVIDLGCGEGRFCRMLAERGARVTGVDLCEPMIAAARTRRLRDEDYRVGDMEDLREIGDARFDIAVSYITLVDVPDLRRAVAEAHRVLRPRGKFVISNLAPMITAMPIAWVKDEQGNKLHRLLDNYLDEGPRTLQFFDKTLTNFHRPLSTYLNTFIECGFTIEAVHEPIPSPAQLARYPSVADHLRVPLFILYLLRKPAVPQ